MKLKVILLSVLAVGSAQAEVITSTFGSQDLFTHSVGYQIGGGRLGQAEEVAVSFIPAADAVLSQIRVAVFNTSGESGDGNFVVDLSEGVMPGTPMETFQSAAVRNAGSIYSFQSTLRTHLTAGHQYWLVLLANDLVNNMLGWNIGNTSSYSLLAERTPGQSLWRDFWNAPPAFEVVGQVTLASIPEPSPFGPLAIGLALVQLGRTGRSIRTVGFRGK